ncbi:MAG: response regulator [Phycisphaeraceae bacterium]
MSSDPHPVSITILVADDDSEDRLMIQRAFQKSQLVEALRFVEDGQALMDYLRRQGPYASPTDAPRPGLILLDLNMPRKDGREALEEIKTDPDLRSIPVVVLTTSRDEEDVLRSYQLGVNSYVTKPVSFDGLVEAMQTLGRYWLKIVELPTVESKEMP